MALTTSSACAPAAGPPPSIAIAEASGARPASHVRGRSPSPLFPQRRAEKPMSEPETMVEAAQRFRAAYLRCAAAVERELAPAFRRMGAHRAADNLLVMARRNEAEADDLDPPSEESGEAE